MAHVAINLCYFVRVRIEEIYWKMVECFISGISHRIGMFFWGQLGKRKMIRDLDESFKGGMWKIQDRWEADIPGVVEVE